MPEELEVANAIIESASLGFGDREFLDCSISLNYGGSGQTFGGYILYIPRGFGNHRLESPAGHFIYRVLKIAGVEEWKNLVGRTIRARYTHNKVYAIGHIINDDWFEPSVDFAALK